MNFLLSHRDKLIAFLIPALLIITLVIVIKSSAFSGDLANYIIVDFLITIPFLYYMFIRKTDISKKTVFSVFVMGIFIASAVMPTNSQGILPTVKLFAIPLIEVFVFGFIIFKSVTSYKVLKSQKTLSNDFSDVILNTCKEVFSPRLGHIVATEFLMLYFALFNWKKREIIENEFTYHKNSTANSVLFGFLVVILVEAFVVHSMIKIGSTSGEIILAALSIYSFLQIVSIIRSLAKRPIFIDKENQQIILRFGLLANAIIPFDEIKEVEISTKELPEKTTIKYFSPLGKMADHNLILHLENEIKYDFLYGFTKKAKSLALFIDEKQVFIETIEKVKKD